MRHVLLVTALAIAACGPAATSTSTAPTTPPTFASTLPDSTTTTLTPAKGCPLESEFVASGRIGRITQPTSDSRALGLISRVVDDGCEKFSFDFETTENAPSTTPPSVDAEFLDGERIVRIHVDIEQTVIADQLVETDLVDRIYVVRALDGSMFIDLHLAEAANARIMVSNSPARLRLELTPRDGELAGAASVSDVVVVINPANEATVGQELSVEGYARTFEANVLILASRGDQVVAQQSATAADWVETWGQFSSDVSLTPGGVNMFVGEESPEDGALRGVTLRLTVQ